MSVNLTGNPITSQVGFAQLGYQKLTQIAQSNLIEIRTAADRTVPLTFYQQCSLRMKRFQLQQKAAEEDMLSEFQARLRGSQREIIALEYKLATLVDQNNQKQRLVEQLVRK